MLSAAFGYIGEMRKADRLFQIIQILRRAGNPITADAIAVELETSKRSVYRDIAALMGQRVPIRGEAGIGYVLDRDFDLPPLMLTVEEIGRPLRLIVPVLFILLPAGLVMKQPDLGTAMMLVLSGGAIFFLAGVRWWKFVLVLVGGGGAAPFAWHFLRDYQKNRILNFLNPENDPLGAGYHSLQSKIAIGSGGLFGKGFMAGSQAHLSFLPEKQTDFIFTMLAEEFGLISCIVLLAAYTLVFIYGFAIAFRSRSHFGRLLALGLTINVFLYVFINTGMVMGLLPVVGVPLPLISYGGTAMLTVMFGFGLMMSVYVHRDLRLGRGGEE